MKKLCVVAAGVESYSNHKYKCTAKSIILLLVASHDAADGCRRRGLAENHRRVAVADGGAPARPRARAGLGLLLLLLGLLVLDLLHLQDLGVAADLLAQAVDEAGDVDALADHLQPVLEVAGDCYRDHPCIYTVVRLANNSFAQMDLYVSFDQVLMALVECIPYRSFWRPAPWPRRGSWRSAWSP